MRNIWLLFLAAVFLVGCGDSATKETPNGDSANQSSDTDGDGQSENQSDDGTDDDTGQDSGQEAGEETSQDADKEESAEDTAQKAFELMFAEYQKAQEEFDSKLAEADKAQRAELKAGAPAYEFADRFFEFALQNEGTNAAFNALNWVAKEGTGIQSVKAMDVLASDPSKAGLIRNMIGQRARMQPSAESEQWFDDVIANSEQDVVRAHALMTKVKILEMVSMAMSYVDDPQLKEQAPDLVVYLQSKKDVDFEQLTIPLLDELGDKYADMSLGRNNTIGKAVEEIRYVFQYLSVGKVAPDIEGEDLDGVEFKLSDYRGKVVMLDFWGDW